MLAIFGGADAEVGFESSGEVVGIIPADLFADGADVSACSKQQQGGAARSLARNCMGRAGVGAEEADEVGLVELEPPGEFGQSPVAADVFFHHADGLGNSLVRFGFSFANFVNRRGELAANLGDETEEPADLVDVSVIAGGVFGVFG